MYIYDVIYGYINIAYPSVLRKKNYKNNKQIEQRSFTLFRAWWGSIIGHC